MKLPLSKAIATLFYQFNPLFFREPSFTSPAVFLEPSVLLHLPTIYLCLARDHCSKYRNHNNYKIPKIKKNFILSNKSRVGKGKEGNS